MILSITTRLLCGCTCGLAIVGYCIGNLAGRGITSIAQCFGSQKKAEEVSKEVFQQPPHLRAAPELQIKVLPSDGKVSLHKIATNPATPPPNQAAAAATPHTAPPIQATETATQRTDGLWDQLEKRTYSELISNLTPPVPVGNELLDANSLTHPKCPAIVASSAPVKQNMLNFGQQSSKINILFLI